MSEQEATLLDGRQPEATGSCCAACVARCAGCLDAVRRALRFFFLPPIGALVPDPAARRLVRIIHVAVFGALALATLLNLGAVVYVILMKRHVYLPFLHVMPEFFDSAYIHQFGVAAALAVGTPWVFGALLFHVALAAFRRTPDAAALLTDDDAPDYVAAAASVSAPAGEDAADEKPPHPLAEVALKLSRRRRLAVFAALVMAFMAVNFALVMISGAIPWGGCGVVLFLHLRHDVEHLRERAGTTGSTFLDDLLTITALPIVGVAVWLFVAAVFLAIAWQLFVVLRHHRARGITLSVVAVLLGAGMTGLLVFAIFFRGGIPAVQPRPPYHRELCFENECGEVIRVGQIGGSTGILCGADGACPGGTTCNTITTGTRYCYFALPLPPTKAFLGPGGKLCIPFEHPPVVTDIHPKVGPTVHAEVQWSGSIYGSTGCDKTGKCQTGVCPDCLPYQGPMGPVTQAEMTLQVTDKDYYDITIINGANLPLAMFPRSSSGAYHPEPTISPAYYCHAPGNPTTTPGQPGASWRYAPANKTKYPLVVAGSLTPCPCRGGEVCGTALKMLGVHPTTQVIAPVCGRLAGMWSDDELCAWTNGAYGECRQLVPGSPYGGTFEQMFGCDGPWATSCFTRGTTNGCCGCALWPELGVTAAKKCHGQTPVWDQQARSRLFFLKQACPSCYTYPFDDATSLFMCRGNGTKNDNSYDLKFCPNGRPLTLG